jgi:sarcosine oxidase subunit beta
VAALVGLDIPVSIWRHDIAFLGPPPTVKLPFPMVIDYATNVYFRPEGTELVLVGLEDENELGGSPDRDTADVAEDFPERAARRICGLIPAMTDATFRTAHSGQDGITPDQRAILGPAGPDGFYLDCGHSGTGFKTAPAIGLCMSELILDGAAQTVDIAPFAFERFAAGRPLVAEHNYEAIWR